MRQVRSIASSGEGEDDTPAELVVMKRCYHELRAVAAKACQILGAHVGLAPQHMEAIIEAACPDRLSDRSSVSQSNLTCLHYGIEGRPLEESAPCPHHTGRERAEREQRERAEREGRERG